NPGVDAFLEHDLEWLKSKTRVVANVAGSTLEDYGAICARLDGKVDFIELNISCPNVKCGGMAFGIRPESIKEVTKVSKSNLKKTPLIVKLSPNVESIVMNARAAQEGGADALSPIIANNTGGVSGAGIKPIAVRMVYEAAHAVSIPVVGMGGITCAEDALEFMMAGAVAVEVGTQNFTDAFACPKIIEGLNLWCEKHGVKNLSEIVNTLRLHG
ncbi:MAG: nitronate monooxygenase, partial [Clostridia bacterium]|nr:nitronate monooxygenase [Clostridia bacterium]